jgi:hypothetical protein
MRMFYFSFVAHPKSTHAKTGEYAGAYIGCWIVRETQQEAESYARGSVAYENWHITGLEEARPHHAGESVGGRYDLF